MNQSARESEHYSLSAKHWSVIQSSDLHRCMQRAIFASKAQNEILRCTNCLPYRQRSVHQSARADERAAQCRSCRRRRRRAHRRCSPPALQSHLLRADLLSSTVFSKTGQANFFRRKSVGAAFDSFHRASKVKFFDLPPVKEKGCHKI